MYYRIGNVYADLAEDKENARENWQKAVAISPGSNAASSAKERLRSK